MMIDDTMQVGHAKIGITGTAERPYVAVPKVMSKPSMQPAVNYLAACDLMVMHCEEVIKDLEEVKAHYQEQHTKAYVTGQAPQSSSLSTAS